MSKSKIMGMVALIVFVMGILLLGNAVAGEKICLLVEIHIKPSALDDFMKITKHDAVQSEKTEPGCLRFDVLRDNDDPLKFYLYEVYKDNAAMLAHRQTPHFAEWAQFMKDAKDRDFVVHRATNFHPTDAEWR